MSLASLNILFEAGQTAEYSLDGRVRRLLTADLTSAGAT
jgi:hypothetical protein